VLEKEVNFNKTFMEKVLAEALEKIKNSVAQIEIGK
jgi:hypothetical protein